MTDPESPIVYIVDDDGAVREALEDLLSSVALGSRSFASVQEFVGAAHADAPSCLVLDVRMPGHSGMAFLAHMAEGSIALPTVMITGHGDIAMSVRAMKDGAIEFLTKPFRDQDLLDAVNRGIEIDRARRATAAETRHVRQLWEALSPGEREVARLVVRGLLNKQVAAELGLSEITVKVRRGNMMRKMEARTLPDLVRAFDRIHAQDRPLSSRWTARWMRACSASIHACTFAATIWFRRRGSAASSRVSSRKYRRSHSRMEAWE